MHRIAEHEFIENDEGGLALLIEEIDQEEPDDPVLLVSPDRDALYFHRGPDDIHEIANVDPRLMDRLRSTTLVLVIEMLGEDICHAYDTPMGLFNPSGAGQDAPGG